VLLRGAPREVTPNPGVTLPGVTHPTPFRACEKGAVVGRLRRNVEATRFRGRVAAQRTPWPNFSERRFWAKFAELPFHALECIKLVFGSVDKAPYEAYTDELQSHSQDA
jgi:hypothetical protein